MDQAYSPEDGTQKQQPQKRSVHLSLTSNKLVVSDRIVQSNQHDRMTGRLVECRCRRCFLLASFCVVRLPGVPETTKLLEDYEERKCSLGDESGRPDTGLGRSKLGALLECSYLDNDRRFRGTPHPLA